MSRGRQTRDCLSETLPDLDTLETFHFDGHLYVGWSRSREEILARAVWSDRTHPLPNSNAPAQRVPLEALSVIWRRSRLFSRGWQRAFSDSQKCGPCMLFCRQWRRICRHCEDHDGRTTYTDHISASPKKLFAILGKCG